MTVLLYHIKVERLKSETSGAVTTVPSFMDNLCTLIIFIQGQPLAGITLNGARKRGHLLFSHPIVHGLF